MATTTEQAPLGAPIAARSTAYTDLLLLLLFVVAGVYAAGHLDLIEYVLEWTEQYEDWEIDELLGAAWFISMAGAIYVGRRAVEYRAILRAHAAASSRALFLAQHDVVTGLANRRRFDERLLTELARARRDGSQLGIFLIDVDRFKAVNDLHGHDAGDALLIQVAERLRAVARDVDVVARLGGDEFGIVQTALGRQEDALAMAKRLHASLGEVYELPQGHVVASASIGVAESMTDLSPDGLIKQADIALYRAKADGRDTFRFYAADMDAALLARRRLEAELSDAFAAEAFEVHYQPQHRVSDRELIGYEALVRWRHPERGLVPPGEFIALA